MLQPDDLDLARIAAALEARFLELAPVAPCTVLDYGFASVVTETAGGVIFRIGREPRSCEGYDLERRLLPAIAPVLPVAVPSPRWCVEPCADFYCGAIGYPKLPGRTLSLDLFAGIDAAALAEAIAALLAALHRMDPASVPGVPRSGPQERRAKDIVLRDATMPVLREHLTAEEYARVETWWQVYLADELMMEFDCVLTHGDLWYGNMLVDDRGHLSAVLDWEIARLGDPARDFAGLKYFGIPFVEDVLRRYAAHGGAVDGALRARIDKVIVVREFYGVLWSIQGRGDHELRESIEKLRQARVLTGADGH